jgi:hypothetical protein
MTQVLQTVLWRGINRPGIEYCTLSQTEVSYQLVGAALSAIDLVPLQVKYQIQCDKEWRTQNVRVETDLGPTQRELNIHVDRQQRWWLNDAEFVPLRGCIDIDLGITPATNTLPIRRLSLQVGGHVEITAAWIEFPKLTVQPLVQRYTRLTERRHQYESLASGFTVEIHVDEFGMVTNYPGLWKRVAAVRGRS